VRGRLHLDQLDVELADTLGLVAVPVLDDALGLAAGREQLDGVLERVAYDAVAG
jgi:hypothetical protein